jgi:hypothetical protein
MWGWATWADRWDKYILDPRDSLKVLLLTWGLGRPIVFLYWNKIFNNLESAKIDTWDYQWILTVWREGGLSCRPSHNLVKNNGFRLDATHTTSEKNELSAMKIVKPLISYSTRLSDIAPNLSLEADDEKKWAQINIRSLALMYFPFLSRFLIFLRGRC